MEEVQILPAQKNTPNSLKRTNRSVQIDRIRVAAYCRVSTDGDEQLGSFNSQKLYYEKKKLVIIKNGYRLESLLMKPLQVQKLISEKDFNR